MTVAPKIKPPKGQTAMELLQAQLALVTADNIALRADRDARDKADAARDVVPPERYLRLKACGKAAGVDYGTAWKQHKNGELDSYVIRGTKTIMAGVNNMIARQTRTGHYATNKKWHGHRD
jgi:hypothetical protein